ncbi:MAG: alpha/beta hydrolase [Actinobacteria bacterium]|nr:alpha/beta hydrolase [Actinomycetota bacterium]MCI0544944.1 alpha/beta hydrolase [Actinomycetota bacterium]MCI0677780.1 alpha/beta hydrolase [Actinomycetota bacterium]
MRARYPDSEGYIDREGVGIYFEVHGEGEPTLMLIPSSPITHSRSWKGQIPYLARHFKVITMDGRGNGRSDRPTAVEAHTRKENIADMLAVMDAAGVDSAAFVAHCHANWWVVELVAAHPERALALVAIEPGIPYLGGGNPYWAMSSDTFEEVLEEPSGWQLFNRHLIETEHRRWLEFFFTEQLVEPHSTKQLEDMVGWGLESTGEILVAGELGQELSAPEREEFEELCRSLDLPILVIHGELDPCQLVGKGRAFADLVEADLVVFEGVGHLPHGREPVKVNRLIKDFVGRVGVRIEVTA